MDFILFGLHLLFLVGETIADNQQYDFHKRKKQPSYRKMPRYAIGFNTFGLWRYSRHPNYVCELLQWVMVYAYLLLAGKALHWSGIGTAMLILLFVGSTALTESISCSKYPHYHLWQKATSCWLPFLDIFFCIKARHKFWQKTEKSTE